MQPSARTAAGYRSYSARDVGRLREVLAGIGMDQSRTGGRAAGGEQTPRRPFVRSVGRAQPRPRRPRRGRTRPPSTRRLNRRVRERRKGTDPAGLSRRCRGDAWPRRRRARPGGPRRTGRAWTGRSSPNSRLRAPSERSAWLMGGWLADCVPVSGCRRRHAACRVVVFQLAF